MKYKFDVIFHIKAAQNMVAEHYMKTILTWFSTSRRSKFNCRALGYERDFDMIFHFNAAKNFVVEHEERDFELIFQFSTAQNVIA